VYTTAHDIEKSRNSYYFCTRNMPGAQRYTPPNNNKLLIVVKQNFVSSILSTAHFIAWRYCKTRCATWWIRNSVVYPVCHASWVVVGTLYESNAYFTSPTRQKCRVSSCRRRPCELCSVHTTRVRGPWTRASFLHTREHGPSRSAGAIVNDVGIIFYSQDGRPKWHLCSRPVFTARKHGPWTRVLCTGL